MYETIHTNILAIHAMIYNWTPEGKKKVLIGKLTKVEVVAQNFKNGEPLSEPFVFIEHGVSFEEIGQLYGGN